MWFCGVLALHGRGEIIWDPQIKNCAMKGTRLSENSVGGGGAGRSLCGEGSRNDVGTAQGMIRNGAKEIAGSHTACACASTKTQSVTDWA